MFFSHINVKKIVRLQEKDTILSEWFLVCCQCLALCVQSSWIRLCSDIRHNFSSLPLKPIIKRSEGLFTEFKVSFAQQVLHWFDTICLLAMAMSPAFWTQLNPRSKEIGALNSMPLMWGKGFIPLCACWVIYGTGKLSCNNAARYEWRVCHLVLKVNTLGKTGGLLDEWQGHTVVTSVRILNQCDYTTLEEDTAWRGCTDDDKWSLLRSCNHWLFPVCLQKNICQSFSSMFLIFSSISTFRNL